MFLVSGGEISDFIVQCYTNYERYWYLMCSLGGVGCLGYTVNFFASYNYEYRFRHISNLKEDEKIIHRYAEKKNLSY